MPLTLSAPDDGSRVLCLTDGAVGLVSGGAAWLLSGRPLAARKPEPRLIHHGGRRRYDSCLLLLCLSLSLPSLSPPPSPPLKSDGSIAASVTLPDRNSTQNSTAEQRSTQNKTTEQRSTQNNTPQRSRIQNNTPQRSRIQSNIPQGSRIEKRSSTTVSESAPNPIGCQSSNIFVAS